MCAEGRGSGARLAALLGDHGFAAPFHEAPPTAAELTDPGVRVVLQPLERGFLYPPLKLASWPRATSPAAAGPTAGPDPGPATPRPSSTTSPPAPTSCTTSTGWAASGAWCAGRSAASSGTTCCSSTRAATSSTCLPTRSTCCAPTPAASHRRSAGSTARTGSGPSPGSGPPSGRSPRSWSCCTRSGSTRPATPSPRTPRGSTRWRRRSPTTRPPISSRPSRTSRPTWRRSAPMDRLVCGDVGFGKTEVAIRAAFKAVQDGKQVAVLVPTTLLASQHFQTFSDRFAGYPVRVEMLSALPHPGPGPPGGRRPGRRVGGRRHRHPPAAVGRPGVQGPGPAGRRRGAALRGLTTRRPSRSCAPTWTC